MVKASPFYCMLTTLCFVLFLGELHQEIKKYNEKKEIV